MKSLNASEVEYWNRYLSSLAPDDRPVDPQVIAGHAGGPEMTDELLALYLSGKKTAGSSVAVDFLAAGDPLPQIGNYWIYLDSKNEPSCILRTERVVFHAFKDVPLEIAIAEGEGDLSLEYWREAHARAYGPHLSSWGIKDINEATIVTEYFRIVFREELRSSDSASVERITGAS